MSKFLTSTALLALSAAPAAALTAQQVWDDMVAAYALFGLQVETGTQEYADGVLRVADLTMTTTFAMDGETFASVARMEGGYTLTERDDGTVLLDSDDRLELIQTTTVPSPEGEVTTEGRTVIETVGDVVVVSEAETGGYAYDATIESMTLRSDGDTVVSGAGAEGADVPAVPYTQTFADMAATLVTDPTDGTYRSETTVGTLMVSVDASAIPEGPVVETAWTNVDGAVSGSIPDAPPSGDSVFPFSDSLALDASFTHRGSTTSMAGTNAQGDYAVDLTSEAGGVSMAVGEALTYDVSTNGLTMRGSVPAFPLPVEASAGSMRTALTMPVRQADAAPWSMDLAVQDLAVDEALWALVDPTGQLPRDPATLALSMSGEAEVSSDLMDPNAMSEMTDAPIRPLTANVTELLLDAVGARLAGGGALTFSDAGPVPMPVGTLNLSLDGGLALMDRAVALGLLPQEQVFFVRAMIGGFAEQTGDDRYETVIEFTPEGGITANGTPIR